MEDLTSLDLSNNNIEGSIPGELTKLSQLCFVNLSSNKLSGPIPFSNEQLSSMHSVSLSPNKGLCGGNFLDLPSCPTTKSATHFVEIFLALAIVPSVIVFACLLVVKRKYKKPQLKERATNSIDVFSVWNYDGRIVYEDLIRATEGFDIRYCIGTGGYGSVYKAQLPNGKVFALKKLHPSETEELAFIKSFRNEAQVLSQVLHRNIVKLYGFCLHRKCMFLIYEYMERGSLFCILHDDDEAVELDWAKRVNIVKAMAHALAYLHHDCSPSIVHRDISSNSILLNSKLEAFVADFGTARLRHADSSNRTLLAGTYGYIAPAQSTEKLIISMDPASSIFRLAALVWVVIFTCDNVAVRTGTIVTASALSPIQLETKALLNTGWWNNSWTTADYSSPGSIIGLHLSKDNVNFNGRLSHLNFSCFPNLESLRILAYYDGFTGSIPSEISALSKLQLLDLSSNRLRGTIPSQIGNLRNLVHLNVSDNVLTGSVPSTLGRLTNLNYMSLSRNMLGGLLPQEIGNLKNLIELDVGDNSLIGPIPLTLSRLTSLKILILAQNQLSGLPQEIGNLKNLMLLDVGNNDIIGPIPSTLGLFSDLSYLDLSCNQFNSSIPNELTRLTQLFHLDLSSNKLSGKIPSQIAIFSVIVFACLLLIKREYEKPKLKTRVTNSIDPRKIDSKYCIGTGAYGSVYKAQLPNGRVFALKKLNSPETEELAFIRSFRNEAQVLSQVLHRNIVKLYGFCFNRKCMFLIYE
ncbi:hypothetical protein CUMW_102700 [Citrus unshiu]|nr:hypothetical protein CUMW_102700 [Citrus unshiu]